MAGFILLMVLMMLVGLAALLHGGVAALPAVLMVAALGGAFYLFRHTRRRT